MTQSTLFDAPPPVWVHPFERAGLGVAPFRCTGVFEKTYQACQGAPVQSAGMCDFCGTCIRYCYQIQSADGRTFVVGCDCVAKTDDTQLEEQVRRAERAYRRELERKAWEPIRAAREAERAAAVAAWREAHAGELAELEMCSDPWVRRLLADDMIGEGALATALRIARRPVSQHVGRVGQRREFTFTTDKKIDLGCYVVYGPRRYMVLGHDEAGNRLVYRGSSPFPGVDDSCRVVATVAEHSEFRGEKQTVISRPKVVLCEDS